MINIANEHFIGEGTFQKCYKHPNNKDLCIKISKDNIKDTRLGNELKYHKRISKKKIKKKDYYFFTKYYGEIETNLGTGYVFDLVKDEITNTPSKTLGHYIFNPIPEISNELLNTEFKKLIQFMIKYKVVANDIGAKNICCRILKNKTVELILVDGLGHRNFIPLVDWSSYFAKKKIERRLRKIDFTNLDLNGNHLKNFNTNISSLNKVV